MNWTLYAVTSTGIDSLLEYFRRRETSFVAIYSNYEKAKNTLNQIRTGSIYKINIELEDAQGEVIIFNKEIGRDG